MANPKTENHGRPPVLMAVHRTQRELSKTWGPILLVTFIAFAVAWFFVEPAPPSLLVIATGSRSGAYYEYAQEYAKVFAANGVTLDVRETAGSIENYHLLNTDEVDVAIVQGGTAPDDLNRDELESLASLYLEPVWVFTHGNEELTDLRLLAGKKIGVGFKESGTRAIAELLLAQNGIQPGEASGQDQTEFVSVGGEMAAAQLRAGKISAAFFVLSPQSSLVQSLLRDPDIQVLSFDRQLAYKQRFPYVSCVTLAEGVVDLTDNVPQQSVQLIAPAANLVANDDLHDAFVPLLLKAAKEVHDRGGAFTEPGEFPSLKYSEFETNAIAKDYFENGPSFLQRYFPFWIASLVSRTKIMLLPLLTLAIPLFKAAPPIYRWRIRSRIYRWYSVLRDIDQRLQQGEARDIKRSLQTLNNMQSELEAITVPLSYMEEFYNLRLHINLVQQQLLGVLEARSSSLGEVQQSTQERPSDHES